MKIHPHTLTPPKCRTISFSFPGKCFHRISQMFKSSTLSTGIECIWSMYLFSSSSSHHSNHKTISCGGAIWSKKPCKLFRSFRSTSQNLLYKENTQLLRKYFTLCTDVAVASVFYSCSCSPGVDQPHDGAIEVDDHTCRFVQTCRFSSHTSNKYVQNPKQWYTSINMSTKGTAG